MCNGSVCLLHPGVDDRPLRESGHEGRSARLLNATPSAGPSPSTKRDGSPPSRSRHSRSCQWINKTALQTFKISFFSLTQETTEDQEHLSRLHHYLLFLHHTPHPSPCPLWRQTIGDPAASPAGGGERNRQLPETGAACFCGVYGRGTPPRKKERPGPAPKKSGNPAEVQGKQRCRVLIISSWCPDRTRRLPCR